MPSWVTTFGGATPAQPYGARPAATVTTVPPVSVAAPPSTPAVTPAPPSSTPPVQPRSASPPYCPVPDPEYPETCVAKDAATAAGDSAAKPQSHSEGAPPPKEKPGTGSGGPTKRLASGTKKAKPPSTEAVVPLYSSTRYIEGYGDASVPMENRGFDAAAHEAFKAMWRARLDQETTAEWAAHKAGFYSGRDMTGCTFPEDVTGDAQEASPGTAGPSEPAEDPAETTTGGDASDGGAGAKKKAKPKKLTPAQLAEVMARHVAKLNQLPREAFAPLDGAWCVEWVVPKFSLAADAIGDSAVVSTGHEALLNVFRAAKRHGFNPKGIASIGRTRISSGEGGDGAKSKYNVVVAPPADGDKWVYVGPRRVHAKLTESPFACNELTAPQ